MSPSFLDGKIIYDEAEAPNFGMLPFDHFVLEKWDVTSTKSESAQKADVIQAWLDLGSQGRLKYHHLQDEVWSTGMVKLPVVPTGVPENLQTPQQRAAIDNLRANAMWVRTWYGNRDVGREQADEQYENLCEHVGADYSEFIRGNFAFDDHEQLFGDPVGAPTVTGITPPYVQALFGCYPDILEGSGGLRPGYEDYIQSGLGVGMQHLMLIVADKRACETGAVLLIGINDFGKMVPERLRVRAGSVHQFCVNWDDGQRLDENFRPGEQGEVDHMLGDDAWKSPYFKVSAEDRRLWPLDTNK